jgi:hypothetical protein
MKYQELDVVELLCDLPEERLRAGAQGVIHQRKDGLIPTYFIEFVTEDEGGFPIMAVISEDLLKLVWAYETHSDVS